MKIPAFIVCWGHVINWVGPILDYKCLLLLFLGLSSCTSKISSTPLNFFLNSQKTLWPFKKTRKHHTPKIMSTYGSQNIWLSEVKIYHQKSIFGRQNISLEVDFRKSKYITRSRLPKIKNHHRKSTSGSQKTLWKSTSVYKENYTFYFILFFKTRITNYKTYKFKKKITLKSKNNK